MLLRTRGHSSHTSLNPREELTLAGPMVSAVNREGERTLGGSNDKCVSPKGELALGQLNAS